MDTRGSAARRRAIAGNSLALALLLATALVLLPLHDTVWWPASPRTERWWQAAAWCLAYLGVCAWCLRRQPAADVVPAGDARLPWLVVHASQTGFATALALHTAEALRGSGAAVVVCAISEVDAALLARSERALFIASTTGEGDPPDPALGFVRDTLSGTADLSGLRYAVLALGDRSYARYCSFGHQLDHWLAHGGARALFDRIDVDAGDPGALRHWQHHLALAAGSDSMPDWTVPRYERWTLASRRVLNPGSLGGPAFHLGLEPPVGTAPSWQAGDIAEIGPCNAAAAVEALLSLQRLEAQDLDAQTMVEFAAQRLPLHEALSRAQLRAVPGAHDAQSLVDALSPLPHREYSIASLPADGSLQLLVRQMARDDGSPGLGSGWLCLHAGIGQAIDLRIRANPNFHPPADARPLLLIGNGTGLAGLRALLKAREASGHRRNWLVFGERQRACDAFFNDEIERWRQTGMIERVDRVFSRDGNAQRYVQDALRAAADELREWIDAGASIHVCGSLEGMAPGVDTALREALGDANVDVLREDGRYRRDVY